MSRTSVMTIGILLILIGVKLNLIESYQLTPQATKFWMERIEDPTVAVNNQLPQFGSGGFNPFQQASYSAMANTLNWRQKVITPPSWACWPVFFLGAVLLLHGLSLKHS